MNTLRKLRLIARTPKPEPKPYGEWSADIRLAAPIYPEDTDVRIRAQSILSGALIGQCPPLSIEEARTVIAWYSPIPTNPRNPS